MNLVAWIKQFVSRHLDNLRLRLAARRAPWELALLGILSGLMAGVVMVAFRLVTEIPQITFLDSNHENYEALSAVWLLLLPTFGGLTVGLLFHWLRPADQAVGVVHVMERLAYGEGHLPIKNAGVQFFSAALCIVSGQSVGREGPAVHIGSACCSWMGQRLRLPDNSIRVLVGCGTAGAIAAAFNTPLAGVIFAMEVILVEYTLASFTPIILAAASATTVAYWSFGPAPVFQVPALSLGALDHLWYVVAMGVAIGILSTVFVRLLVFFSWRLTTQPVWLRMMLAGTSTGILALWAPQIMGIGYDTVNAIFLGELGLQLLLVVLLCKLLATSLGLGFGLPGGVIGPTLMLGALAGGVVGTLVTLNDPQHTSSPALYAMLGMGAMMGATLNAPLAALTALLELTANPYIILPAMLAIVTAELTCHHGFHTPSVFLKLMEVRGLEYSSNPISQFLRRLGVTHVMDRGFAQFPRHVNRHQLEQSLTAGVHWIQSYEDSRHLLISADLQRFLATEPATVEELDLNELPLPRIAIATISAQATLEGALRKMEQHQVSALGVVSHWGTRVLGIITREAIERSYRLPLN